MQGIMQKRKIKKSIRRQDYNSRNSASGHLFFSSWINNKIFWGETFFVPDWYSITRCSKERAPMGQKNLLRLTLVISLNGIFSLNGPRRISSESTVMV
jgi:hypothetical protein